jgi:hypothetical protein
MKWITRGRGTTGLKDWMLQHNAVITTVLCLIIGDAITGLSSSGTRATSEFR